MLPKNIDFLHLKSKNIPNFREILRKTRLFCKVSFAILRYTSLVSCKREKKSG